MSKQTPDTQTPDTLRQNHRDLTENEQIDIREIKERAAELMTALDVAESHMAGTSREIALAKTRIEEAVMWAVKGVTARPATKP